MVFDTSAQLQPDLRSEWEQRRKDRQAAKEGRKKVATLANAAMSNRFVSKAIVGGTAGSDDAAATASVGGLKSVGFAPGLTTGAQLQEKAKQAAGLFIGGGGVKKKLARVWFALTTSVLVLQSPVLPRLQDPLSQKSW